MIYKNGKPYQFAQEELNMLKKVKFPVVIKLPGYLVTKSKIIGQRDDRPKSILIPSMVLGFSETEGTVEWRYCKTAPLKDKKDNLIYNPHGIDFTGYLSVSKEQMDLYYFLCVLSPHCENPEFGDQNPSAIKYYRIENKSAEAEKKVADKKARARITSLLFDETVRIEDAQLKLIAKAMMLSNVDGQDADEIRLVIEKLTEDKDYADMFIDLSAKGGKNANVKHKSQIQVAIDKGVVQFNPMRKAWHYVDPQDGKQGTKITTANTGDPSARLLEFFENNETALTELAIEIDRHDKFKKAIMS